MEINMNTISIVATIIGTAVAITVPCCGLVWLILNLRLKVLENSISQLEKDRAKDLELLEKINDKLDKLTEKLIEKYVTKEECDRAHKEG